jgi:NADP-dependent 3-hydroxy acid dehydrogenase YdfG
MQSMKDKLVLITGASSGIGASCAHKFAAEGAKLILNARRNARLEELASFLRNEFKANCLLLPFDVRELRNVKAGLENLPKEWQAIDVLINNARLARGLDKLPEGNIEGWEEMIDTNLKGLLYVTPIRVSTISPGLVETEFSQVRFRGDKERAAKAYRGLTPLSAEDVAEVVSFCVTRPSHVNINEVILMPTAQATSTLVHRRQ